MTLDVFALSGELRAMSALARDSSRSLAARVAQAWAVLRAEAGDWEFWGEAAWEQRRRNMPFLVAQPREPMDVAYDTPPCPAEYVIAASDGSQLDASEGLVPYTVVNVGTVLLRYGVAASYHAQNKPTLRYQPYELSLQDPDTKREYPMRGVTLAAERDVQEGWGLYEAASTFPDDITRLAVQDGTLIRWSLADADPYLQKRFLGDYLSYLETMRALGCPVASYMSKSEQNEVRGLAHFLLARGDVAHWRGRFERKADEPFAGIRDHMLFSAHLQPGQRGARFASLSRILDDYGDNRIEFFYLNVGREIARVEFPAWIVEQGHLETVHALVYDQAQRGMGYPVALQRAHEQAVIHETDRRHLDAVIERLLAQAEVSLEATAKTATKLQPRV